MRLALIADIHGNLLALEAVLAELEREGVDRVVCLGDVAVGPQPLETLRRIQALDCTVVMGNWDEYLLDGPPKAEGELAQALADMCAWTATQLSPGDREYLGSFLDTVEIELGDRITLLAFHGSPRSTEEEILATTSDNELDVMLSGHEASVFAGGHTHFQLFRRYRESVIVNAGSVGLPFRRQLRGVMPISPWAEHCLVTCEDGRLSIELRRTPFDIERFISALRRSGMPHAERWAGLWGSGAPRFGASSDITGEMARFLPSRRDDTPGLNGLID